MSSDVELDPLEQDPDSEGEIDWEQVDVPEHLDVEPEEQHIEITLNAIPSSSKSKKTGAESKRKAISHEERLMRIHVHKSHTVVLLANAKVRNSWINDDTLQARLMSLTPITLQNEFSQIHKSRIPDQGQRGRMFEKALQHLAQWWSGSFFEVLPSGHIRSHTFDEIQSGLVRLGILHEESELDDDTLEELLGYDIECVRGPKSLMKHALNRNGSRDVSAQLFTSLCRALAIPARLVVSLQSVPWQPSVGKPKPTYARKDPKGKGKAPQIVVDDEAETSSSFSGIGQRLDGESVPMSEKAKGKQKAEPVIKLRKQKAKGQRLGSSTPSSRLATPDPTTSPPVFWTEVFSRPDSRWMPVDPVRGLVNKRKAFDPTPTPASAGGGAASAANSSSMLPPRPQGKPNNYSLPKGVKQENRMQYVIAFEEDGYARDVTRRYAREYNAKIAKSQGGSGGANSKGKARGMWWESVLGLVKRPYQLHRDDLEDEELVANQMMEGMPTTIAGFKDHPLYALARHLKQNEIIHPPPPETPEIGKFRGEPVYPRSSVVSLKSAETWMRTEGRIIKAGFQPLKTIKARPATVGRMRELEVMKDELRDAGHSTDNIEVLQGLYSRPQTELYIPDPVVDGKIPKNSFGNIDLYVPSMLPPGAVHLPYKGVAKIARKLGLDYAEAVTGFEFRKKRANAVIDGVVIAAENESALLEAYWEAQQAEEEKAKTKREERALQNWIKIIQGLRIRQRLINEYADRGPPPDTEAAGSTTPARKRARRSKAASGAEDDGEDESGVERSAGAGSQDDEDDKAADRHGEDQGGGFLIEADDVVQAFHLPKYNPLILASSDNLFALGGGREKKQAEEEDLDGVDDLATNAPVIDYVTYDLDEHDASGSDRADVDMDGIYEQTATGSLNALRVDDHDVAQPKTMQELLDADGQQAARGDDLAQTLQSTGVAGVTESSPGGLNIATRSRTRSGNNNGKLSLSTPNTKKRKRGKAQEGSTEEDTASEEDEFEGEDDDVDRGQGEADEDSDDDVHDPIKSQAPGARKARPAVKKRQMQKPKQQPKRKAKAPAVAPPPTDRVLRSRRSKN